MNRRELLHRLGLTVGGLAVLPTWANAWSPNHLAASTWLSPQEDAVLSTAVDTLLPATDTPGAKELGVPSFVSLMIQDVYEKKDQDLFKKFLAKLDTQSSYLFGKPLAQATEKQRQLVLSSLEASENADVKRGYGIFKNLTIQGYLTSEYVMTHILPYEFIPSRYHGCVPVNA